MPIEPEEIAPLVLAVLPSFGARWAKVEADWGQEKITPYTVAGEVALHAIELVESGRDAELEGLFQLIERLHVEGDAFVRELATIGFLEAIQNIASHRANPTTTEAAILPLLGPQTARWWRALKRFWRGETSSVTIEDEALEPEER